MGGLKSTTQRNRFDYCSCHSGWASHRRSPVGMNEAPRRRIHRFFGKLENRVDAGRLELTRGDLFDPKPFEYHQTPQELSCRIGRVSEWLAASLEMKCRVTGCGFESRALRSSLVTTYAKSSRKNEVPQKCLRNKRRNKIKPRPRLTRSLARCRPTQAARSTSALSRSLNVSSCVAGSAA